MKKVMIVDDEKDTVDAVLNILKSVGYDTMFAYNGRQCLSKIRKEQPDLILLDVMMPGMTAREVIREINKDKELRKITIIYLTAVTASEEEKKTLIYLGHVVDFIEKPFKMNDLLERVKKALRDRYV